MQTNEVISYLDMCKREGLSLQRGMNFNAGRSYSIILMSRHPGAPYEDEVRDSGRTLIYEGHDVPRTKQHPNPKDLDQEEFLPSGKPTENGKFRRASEEFKQGLRVPEKVRVYEKIRDGIWSYNGLFNLVDCWIASTSTRRVFKFKLEVAEDEEKALVAAGTLEHRRIIPTSVKLEVWKRDGGKCIECGSSDNLHFDHIIPFSKGGASIRASNIQLLCARHNLEKHDMIK